MTEGTLPSFDPRFQGRYDTVLINQTVSGLETHRPVVVLGSPDSAAFLSGDLMLDIPKGDVSGVTSVNKFGENQDVDTSVEDIWTGGGTWVAPTAARTHQIASTDANDTAAGTGARTIRVYGLPTWDTAEVAEDITMNGTTNVPTVNDYVIIHRKHVLTKGASGPNLGVITATADTDGTVTSRIEIGDGQTLMTIYGVPSVQTLYLTLAYASVQKATTANIDTRLLVNPEPDVELTGFLCKQIFAVVSVGNALAERHFKPYFPIPGPAIVKISGESSAVNASVSGGFDGILVTN